MFLLALPTLFGTNTETKAIVAHRGRPAERFEGGSLVGQVRATQADRGLEAEGGQIRVRTISCVGNISGPSGARRPPKRVRR